MKTIIKLSLIISMLVILLLCFSFNPSNEDYSPTKTDIEPQELLKTSGKWFYFKKGNKILIEDLFKNSYTILGLPQGVGSKIERKDVDEYGMTHYQVKLEMNNIPIEDALYTVHYSKDGDLMHVVGQYRKEDFPTKITHTILSETNAFTIALGAYISTCNFAGILS
jgi:Zn-dependent metalloprotease